MSHTINLESTIPSIVLVSLTIVNYTAGGESITASELGFGRIAGIIFQNVPASGNSLGKILMPVLNGGKIMLFQGTSSGLVEIGTTTALNAAITALVVLG